MRPPPAAPRMARRSSGPGAPVFLNVYDLGTEDALESANDVMRGLGTGAFHVGVEVHFVEWSFGSLRGVESELPRSRTEYRYRESIPMGTTQLTQQQIQAIISQLSPLWPFFAYDILHRNCVHFAEQLCAELGVEEVPSWLSSLAGFAASMESAGLPVADAVL